MITIYLIIIQEKNDVSLSIINDEHKFTSYRLISA